MTGRVTATHCPYCALQCGMNLVSDKGVVSVAPRAFPTNNGGLCQKGWTAAELLSNRERLTSPLVRDRRASELRPATWDESARSDRGGNHSGAAELRPRRHRRVRRWWLD